LMEVAVEAKEQGQRIGLVDREDRLVTKIVGI
jgi:hypothetical protein